MLILPEGKGQYPKKTPEAKRFQAFFHFRKENPMNSIFSLVSSAVTAREAAEYYGLKVGRNGMAVCPFHGDRHPSMKLDERYYCFGCHATGDAIDLVANLFDLRPLDAARKLAADFHLDPNTPAPAASPSKRVKEERDLEGRCTRALVHYRRLLGQRQAEYAPSGPDAPFDPRFGECCRKLAGVDEFLELLYHPDEGTRRKAAECLIRCGAIDRLEREVREAA